MPAQTVRTGVPSGRSKRKKKRVAGDLGQDPGEMVTAGVQLALVRLGPDEYCRGWGGGLRAYPIGAFMTRRRELKVFSSGVYGGAVLELPGAPGAWGAAEEESLA